MAKTTLTPLKTMPLFPLIRFLSRLFLPLLLRLPLSPNQITALSLFSGLGAAWFFATSVNGEYLLPSLLLIFCYLLDNCDGDVARARNQTSRFGEYFDTATDWIVHSLFFLALGHGLQERSGEAIWFWLGCVAAMGSTINYAISLFWKDAPQPAHAPAEIKPEGWKEALIYFFRELSRADFCFIVLGLALVDATWILLPLSAIGAQVYWLIGFLPRARTFHV